MAFPQRRTLDILLTTLLFGVVCAAVYSARRIILIFIFAIFFAYLIDPVVKFLQRHSLFFRNLRGPAVVEVYIAFVILIALLGYTFAPRLAKSTVKLVDEAPVVLNSLSTGDIAAELRGKYGWSEEQGRHRAPGAGCRSLYFQCCATVRCVAADSNPGYFFLARRRPHRGCPDPVIFSCEPPSA